MRSLRLKDESLIQEAEKGDNEDPDNENQVIPKRSSNHNLGNQRFKTIQKFQKTEKFAN